MFKSKYSTVLTVILIILILAIIIILSIVGVNTYKEYKIEKQNRKIFTELQEEYIQENENTEENDENILVTPVENTLENTTINEENSTPKAKFYDNEYQMIGYIYIEKTKINYPILLDVSPKALEKAVGVSYPSNPNLNEPGNTVIIGHNYRNGKLFSNNKKLAIGDKIQITDLTGRTLTYTIYEISVIPETDTEYMTRERGNNTEISLSTCTDDGQARLVILAKV